MGALVLGDVGERCRPCCMWKTSLAVKVPGEGNPDAQVVLIGEGLGREEEYAQRPFVGRAGWMLDSCLKAAGLNRADVWLTNGVRCRPKTANGGNRKPTDFELACCRGWMDDELATLGNRRVLVALGDSATYTALAPHDPTGGVQYNQGRIVWSERYQCWTVLTLHPAFALRKPGEALWLIHDLVKAIQVARDGAPRVNKVPRIRVVHTLDDAFEMKAYLLARPKFFWDWETDGLHPARARGFCVSFCAEDDFAWVLPRFSAGFRAVWRPTELQAIDREVLVPIFTSDVEKGGHHVAFDGQITMTTLGVYPENITTCTMLMNHLGYNHLSERSHGLKRMSDLYTPYGRYDDAADDWLFAHKYTDRGRPDWNYGYLIPDEIMHPYNGTDSVVPRAIEPLLAAKLKAEGLWDVYVNERLPLALMYMDMDRRGVRISGAKLETLSADLAVAIDLVDNRIAQLAGKPVNTQSPDQVSRFLFDECGLPILGRTETGAPSTKEEFLKDLAPLHPIVPLVLHSRTYKKLKGTFVDGTHGHVGGLKAAVDPDGYARMNTLLTVVETFRLATRRPFPIHTLPRPLVLWTCEVGLHGHYLFDQCCDAARRVILSIRALVVPDDRHVLIQGDHVQQEYVIQCIAARQTDMEEAMLDRREDAHEFVMKQVGNRSKYEYMVEDAAHAWRFTSKEAENEYKNLRAHFKRINFLMLFRGGAKKLARNLSTREHRVEPVEAEEMIAVYYGRLPHIKAWQDDRIQEVRSTGRVRGLFGPYRVLPQINSPDKFDQYEAERAACNFPVQEGGTHVTFRGAIKLDRKWRGKLPLRAPFPGRLLFTLHDEVVAQAREDLAEQATVDMRSCMEAPHPELVGGCGIARGVYADIKVAREWGGEEIKELVARAMAV